MTVLAAAAALGALGGSSPAADAAAAERDTAPVFLFASSTEVAGAWSTLVRTDNGVAMTVHTASLTPGTVVTAWWVFFNNPSACTAGLFGARCGGGDFANPATLPSVQAATGRVIGGNGVGDYGAYFAAGATPDCVGFGLPCNGLLAPRNADVHITLRLHGPAVPSLITEQLSSFNGSCLLGEPNEGECRNVQVSMHEAG